jgi:hypothetical protein
LRRRRARHLHTSGNTRRRPIGARDILTNDARHDSGGARYAPLKGGVRRVVVSVSEIGKRWLAAINNEKGHEETIGNYYEDSRATIVTSIVQL